ncbi:MAG TPA: sigma-70 family RNA polymerase sigma factor [Gemmataceae bacterium]|nr:sigma-70 family RNA polymerase sigma factor [Gemmataceae bacterium]
MADTDDFPTQSNLLRQLRSLENQEAWKEFFDGYTGLIDRWCRRRKLRGDQVEEVVAQILAKLVRALPGFAYNRDKGRFRDWLRKIVSNEVNEYWRRFQQTPGGQGRGADGKEGQLEQLPDSASIEELSDELSEQMCRHLQQAEQIMEIVRDKVEPHTWEAYWLTAIQGWTAREAADHLKITLAAVSQAKYRVGKMLQDELQQLQKSSGG